MKKNLWSLMLILAMAMAMMLGMNVTANAETEYPIWVGETHVTSEVFSGEGWSYTAANGNTPATLTLNGYEEPWFRGNGHHAAIYANEDLKIVLVGENTVTNNEGGAGILNYGIFVEGGKLTIQGYGSLTANVGKGGGHGIAADNGLTIAEGARVTARGDEFGISTNNVITINGGELYAEGDRYGINTNDSDVIIIAGKVTAIGECGAIFGTVKNAIPGIGWTDTEGTLGKAILDADPDWGYRKDIMTSYQKVQFLNPVSYMAWDSTQSKLVENTCREYTVVESSEQEVSWNGGTDGKWYAVTGDDEVMINNRITITGEVNLILCDRTRLHMLGIMSGITVEEDSTLNIYKGWFGDRRESDGELTVCGTDFDAGIGGGEYGRGGTVNIHGGTVNAEGARSAGIISSTVNIHGGTVNAKGGRSAAGIDGGTVNIDGGTVHAKGGSTAGINGTLILGNGMYLYGDSTYLAAGTGSEYTGSRYQYMVVNNTAPAPNYKVNIKAKKTKITYAKATKGKKSQKALVKWKKVSGISGYVLAYSTSKKFIKKTTKKVFVSKNATKKTLKKLKKGKNYYVKIIPYISVYDPSKNAKVKVYGKWSNLRKIKAGK